MHPRIEFKLSDALANCCLGMADQYGVIAAPTARPDKKRGPRVDMNLESPATTVRRETHDLSGRAPKSGPPTGQFNHAPPRLATRRKMLDISSLKPADAVTR